MKKTLMIAVALFVLGVAILGYERYSYTTQEKILQIGPLTATADQTHVVTLPPIIGWVLIGTGACVLMFGIWSRRV